MTTNETEDEATIPSIVLPPTNIPQIDSNQQQRNTNTIKRTSGIFEFMTSEKAIELYKKIHEEGIPALDWKFYGRRKPGESDNAENKTSCQNEGEDSQVNPVLTKEEPTNEPIQTEFDFDDEFNEPQMDVSAINESLQLKKRTELGSERKTNLSDIMSDIMKETSISETD